MDKILAESADRIEPARAGDQKAREARLSRYRDRLCRTIEMRLDARVQARLDASNVLPDAYVEIAAHPEEHLRDPGRSVFLWLRLVVGERLRQAIGGQPYRLQCVRAGTD
jgi:RNA polymerase sigma-70 factor (ECF subfamily)